LEASEARVEEVAVDEGKLGASVKAVIAEKLIDS